MTVCSLESSSGEKNKQNHFVCLFVSTKFKCVSQSLLKVFTSITESKFPKVSKKCVMNDIFLPQLKI